MIDLCIAVTISLTCSWWSIVIVDTQEEVQTMWDIRTHEGKYGNLEVHGFNDSNEKLIVLYWGDLGNFKHEWRHAYCHEYYFYHLGRNHPTICEPFPHFKIQL